MYNHIKWDYGVTGYLSEKEKQVCTEIDAIVSNINAQGKNISVKLRTANCLLNNSKSVPH